MSQQYPTITEDWEIEVEHPDDPMELPIAKAELGELHELLIPGDYLGLACDPTDRVEPFWAHVHITQDTAVASHRNDPQGRANPERMAKVRQQAIALVDEPEVRTDDQEVELG